MTLAPCARRIRPLVLAFASCLAGVAAAAPVVVNFENYATTGVHAAVNSGGFSFAPLAGTIAVAANGANCNPTCAANGTTALVVGAPNLNPPSTQPVTMTTGIYSSFRLTGLDYAELSNNFVGGWSASSIVMTGWLIGGGTVTQTLLIDGLNDGPGGANDFQSAVLDSFWATSELGMLRFTGFIGDVPNHGFQLDNIALDVTRAGDVPEPGSLALAGLALAALWQARRRRG